LIKCFLLLHPHSTWQNTPPQAPPPPHFNQGLGRFRLSPLAFLQQDSRPLFKNPNLRHLSCSLPFSPPVFHEVTDLLFLKYINFLFVFPQSSGNFKLGPTETVYIRRHLFSHAIQRDLVISHTLFLFDEFFQICSPAHFGTCPLSGND